MEKNWHLTKTLCAIGLGGGLLIETAWAEAPICSFSGQTATPEFAFALSGVTSHEEIPPFRVASRNRTGISGDGVWYPHNDVFLQIRATHLTEHLNTNTLTSGFEGLTVGAMGRVWDRQTDLALGWQAHLPGNNQLADETNVDLLLDVTRELNHAHLGAVGGMSILGNPLRFANQDDIPLSWIHMTVPRESLIFRGSVGGGWATARNPARMASTLGVEGQCPKKSGISLTAGLTPAAPDWAVRAWFGWGWGCTP